MKELIGFNLVALAISALIVWLTCLEFSTKGLESWISTKYIQQMRNWRRLLNNEEQGKTQRRNH